MASGEVLKKALFVRLTSAAGQCLPAQHWFGLMDPRERTVMSA
jgi:hypothetical protein